MVPRPWPDRFILVYSVEWHTGHVRVQYWRWLLKKNWPCNRRGQGFSFFMFQRPVWVTPRVASIFSPSPLFVQQLNTKGTQLRAGSTQTWSKTFSKLVKLEILHSLGGWYDGLAFKPPTGLSRLHFSALSDHHLLIDIHVAYTYTMNYSCFHPLLFLSAYLQEISSVLE